MPLPSPSSDSPLGDPGALRSFRVMGTSMQFLLEPGDAVVARPVPLEELRSGDLVVCRDPDSGYGVVHRLLGKKKTGEEVFLTTKGDFQARPDRPRPARDFVGRVGLLWRKGGTIAAKGLPWRLANAAIALYSYGSLGLLSVLRAALRGLILRSYLAAREERAKERLLRWIDWETAVLEPSLERRLKWAPGLLLDWLGGSQRAGAVVWFSREEGLRGRVGKRTVLRGEVKISGDVIIPEGCAVTVLPGTTLAFQKTYGRASPILRPVGGRWRIMTGRFLATWIVYGTLEVLGEERRPVEILGERGGGFLFLGRSRGLLLHLGWRDESERGIVCWDYARVRARGCRLGPCEAPVRVGGRARAVLDDCEIDGRRADGEAIHVEEDGALDLREVRVFG